MELYSGYEYLLIDIANCFGKDKEQFVDRILWVQEHMEDLESFMDQADEPMQFIKAVRVLRDAQQGKASGHMVTLDACASGLQLMAAVMGCPVTAANTGLTGQVRADIYTKTTEVMNHILKDQGIQVSPSRDDVKYALMTMSYGSKMKPIELFGEDTPELAAFYAASRIVAPGAMVLMEALRNAWQPFALVHEWVMPDGFDVRVKVMQSEDVKIEVDDLDHATFTHRFFNNEGSEKGISLIANITHSLDSMVIRELNRRCNYDYRELSLALLTMEDELAVRGAINAPSDRKFISLALIHELDQVQWMDDSDLQRLYVLVEETLENKSFPIICIHDAMKCSPNNMNRVRAAYIDIFAELAESYVIEDILKQITGEKVVLQKDDPDLGNKIRAGNYALS